MTTIEPATPASEWAGKTPDEIKAEINTLINAVMDRRSIEVPREKLARRLGFALGEDWGLTRLVLAGVRVFDPGAFIRWGSERSCYEVTYNPVLPGEVQAIHIEGTLLA